nr:putative integron gene cassette protein [uncultured bacterium]
MWNVIEQYIISGRSSERFGPRKLMLYNCRGLVSVGWPHAPSKFLTVQMRYA